MDETYIPPDNPPAPASFGEAARRLGAALFTSRKFVAFLVGLLLTYLSKKGIVLPPDMAEEVVGLAVAYILGQGLADYKKEAAKLQSQSDAGR